MIIIVPIEEEDPQTGKKILRGHKLDLPPQASLDEIENEITQFWDRKHPKRKRRKRGEKREIPPYYRKQ